MRYLHPSISPEFSEYLIKSGFDYTSKDRFNAQFDKGNVRITISFLKVDVLHFSKPAAETVYPAELRRHHSFTDVHKLDFIGWVLLLHITGALEATGLIRADEAIKNILFTKGPDASELEGLTSSNFS